MNQTLKQILVNLITVVVQALLAPVKFFKDKQ